MDFLTQEYVKEQAELGELEALKCSLAHHIQGRDADWVELRDAMGIEKFYLGHTSCAICIGRNCCDCPLTTTPDDDHHCCDGKYHAAYCAYETLSSNYSNANFKAFQEAEAGVCTYIQGVIAKKEAEQEKIWKTEKTCFICKHQKLSILKHPCKKCGEEYSYWQPKEPKEPKPELGHGDYGYNQHGEGILILSIDGTLRSFIKGRKGIYDHNPRPEWYTILGNLFDDLKLYSEDLTEFRVGICHVHIENNMLMIHQGNDKVHLDGDRRQEFHQKLGRLIATTKKKQGKGK